MFAVLMVCVGGLIGWLNYSQISKLIISASDQLYENVAKETVLNYQTTYNPVSNSLKLLAYSTISDATNLEQRIQYVDVISAVLNTDKAISAIQFGYDSGDYFIARKTDSEKLKDIFSAPDNTVLIVDNISSNKDRKKQLVRIYFDDEFNVLKKDEPVTSQFDPRTRPWFKQAGDAPRAIDPYYFYFMKMLGTTVTIKMHQSSAVVATDITLDNISAALQRSKMTPGSELYLVKSDGQLVASSSEDESLIKEQNGQFNLKNIHEINSKVFLNIPVTSLFSEQSLSFYIDGSYWKGSVKYVSQLGGDELYLMMFTPVKELLEDAIDIAWLTIYLLLLIVALTLPVIWVLSKRISNPMRELAQGAQQIMNFDFSRSDSDVRLEKTRIREVDALVSALALMKSSLSQFIGLISSLSAEKDFDSLLDKITLETLHASKANAVATYLVDEESQYLKANSLKLVSGELINISCLPEFSLKNETILADIIQSNECKYLHLDVETDSRWFNLSEKLNDSEVQIIVLPLRDRQSEFMGMIVLSYQSDNEALINNEQQVLSFVQAFSSFAAVSLESKHLLKVQEELLDSFIKLIAGAIDAKSPYTGGHCQRVPELTKMLAQAACDSSDPVFSEYQLTQDQWYEIHIASWLHDCGKVTTPEYVVDKSTKLETIYDRIHEIRMRFELLKRDAEVDYWKALNNGEDETSRTLKLKQKINSLDKDFEFVAACNQGGEFMADEKLQRLKEISDYRWTRTLDDRLGVSWEELQRMEKQRPGELPVEEKLLDDKSHQLIERTESDKISDNNIWGFKLDVPEYKFNKGELYNLSVAKGTLTEEERFIINGHMVQTIIMLEQLPFPSFLKNVPIIAGCHHETMDGKGYPKRLLKEDMPLTARMMAIADIFEALTASDRPYKKSKTLTESLRIMSFMRDDNHIDADLFDLFLTSKIYLDYAQAHLNKDQIDSVDIKQYLSAN